MGMLASSLANAIALMTVGLRQWKPMLRFRWSDVRPYLDFGLYQMGERAVNYLGANTDYVLIGRYLGPSVLGTYSVAYQLVVKPVTLINPMLNRVAFPVFAARADDDTLRRGYLHVVRLLAYVTFPLLLGLAILAPDFVRVALGPKWEASIPVLQVLCGVGILRSLANPVGSVLLAKNRPDLGFKGNVVLFAAMAIVLLIAIQFGIMAVAWASLAVTLVAYVGWLLVLRRVVGLRAGEYVRALRAPCGFSVVMAGCMELLHLSLSGAAVQPLLVLVAVGSTGSLVYAGMLAAFDASYVRGLWRLFTGGGAPTASAER
jgi:O-antigen/teichoic acid export membrane protein